MARGRLILDRYEPLGTAGSGGFGTVQIAWDTRIQRKVAIKIIPLSEADALRATLPGAAMPTAQRWHGVQPWNEFLAEDIAAVSGERNDYPPAEYGPDDVDEPFTSLAHLPGLDEARTAAKLQDPRIVGVFDFEVRGQTAYLIMEYVQGITLTQLLVDYEDYLTLDVVAAVFDAVSGALSAAHKAGVLHLDIKPDNILINMKGQAKVTDFGLATLADAAGTGLAGGGTIGYMPLEQMRREPLDARTDEWSLAAVTYEMLSGDNPFHAPSLDEAQKAIEDAELVLPSLCWESIDEQIDDVIFYALDPDPANRYATVADFAEEVDKFLGDAGAGERQLAAIVADALEVYAEEDEYAYEDDYSYDDAYDSYADEAYSFGESFDAYGGDDLQEADEARRSRRSGRTRRERQQRRASSLQDTGQVLRAMGRVVVALSAAVITGFSLSRLAPFVAIVGAGRAPVASLVSAALVAVLSAFLPHVGMLVAGLIAGFYLVVGNHVVLGAAVALASIIWCYAYSRLAQHGDHPVWATVIAAVLGIALAALFAYLR